MSLTETAAAVNGAFSSIPVIDMSKCGTPEGKLATALEIRDACIRVGFFYIRNHGISQSCLDNAFTMMQKYFDLPMATKMKLYHKSQDSNFKGYSPPFDSNIDSANNDKGDLHEGFEVGWEEIEAKENDEKRANDGVMRGANVWPEDDYPDSEKFALNITINVGRKLFPLFALALDLPETYFDDKTRNAAALMRMLHYPSHDGYPDIDEDNPGIGAHSDILWQQPEIQVLQVMNSEKQWINATPIEGTLVVNIGDQLAFWTNDIFKSTIHRVINKTGKERYSIPLFFGTDYHVNIEPIPTCVTADRPAKYSPITSGEYVNKRLREMYHA
ncbi:2OG-Fe(II) oxygenase [Chiua virens]|nr:2OG-Fe(II) oxygenase [Chiua virens]